MLQDISVTIDAGEMVALIGASGSGKSTLIRAIAGLITIDRPDRRQPGGGASASWASRCRRTGASRASAARLRARIGVIFQQFNLVPRLSVLTNVCLGLLGQIPAWRGTLGRLHATTRSSAPCRRWRRVGIAEQALKRGSELSGGQQQRAAIARTLVQGAERADRRRADRLARSQARRAA